MRERAVNENDGPNAAATAMIEGRWNSWRVSSAFVARERTDSTMTTRLTDPILKGGE